MIIIRICISHNQILLQVIPDVNEANKDLIYGRIYEYFMEEIDAVDNGENILFLFYLTFLKGRIYS